MVKLLDQTISPELDKTGYRLRLTCGKTLWINCTPIRITIF